MATGIVDARALSSGGIFRRPILSFVARVAPMQTRRMVIVVSAAGIAIMSAAAG
jgi:hypothetical protein